MTESLLCRVWSQPNQRPDLTLAEWELILGQARQSMLLGRLAQHLLMRDWLSQVPSQPRQYLEGALRLVDRQHHEVRWEVDRIRQALSTVQTPVVMLKGAAYFVAGLAPRHGRLFSDIDILVAKDRLPEVEGALFRAGWIGDERDAYNQRYYREWMHEIPPLKHVQRGTVIDVHHTITPPTSRFRVDGAKLLERIVAIDDKAGLFVLAPVDMVLHSAVHLFQEGDFGHGLRDLLDLSDLLGDFSSDPNFWPELFARASELGLQVPLHHALFHIERILGVSTPAQWAQHVQRLRKNGPAPLAMAWLLGLALQPDHPSCDSRWSGFARWVLYVRSHALRMPLHQLVPHLVRKMWMHHFPEQKEIAIVAKLDR